MTLECRTIINGYYDTKETPIISDYYDTKESTLTINNET